jgi:hypothetical protein
MGLCCNDVSTFLLATFPPKNHFLAHFNLRDGNAFGPPPPRLTWVLEGAGAASPAAAPARRCRRARPAPAAPVRPTPARGRGGAAQAAEGTRRRTGGGMRSRRVAACRAGGAEERREWIGLLAGSRARHSLRFGASRARGNKAKPKPTAGKWKPGGSQFRRRGRPLRQCVSSEKDWTRCC